MSKITVIQLLNKIANGEEVPEKIKYNGTEYKLNELTGWYQSIDVIGNVDEWFISKYRLNDTVEIMKIDEFPQYENAKDINIQDIKEIDEHFSLKYINSGLKKETEEEIDRTVNKIYYKINEIQKAVKYLEKTKEDK